MVIMILLLRVRDAGNSYSMRPLLSTVRPLVLHRTANAAGLIFIRVHDHGRNPLRDRG
jgi:hypothetical protein